MNQWVNGTYLVTAICFIIALKLLNGPKTARTGNLLAAFGMAAALVATFMMPGFEYTNIAWIAIALVLGSLMGALSARRVQMTAMPQMVALFNGLGGGAVALVATIEYFAHGDVAWTFGEI